MTLNPIGGADLGASIGLRRWMEVLERSRTESAGPTGAVEHARAAALRASRSAAAGTETVAAAHTRPDGVLANRLDPAALDAHAAVGELTARRDTYAGVEETIARAGVRLGPVLADVDLAYARARERAADGREDAAARSRIHTAIGAATAEFAATDRRLAELTAHGREAVRDTVSRANTLAQEIATDNRDRVQERRRAREQLARGDERVAQARAEDDRLALDRRDAAARELGRLVGASTRTQPDGTLEVRIGPSPFVVGDRVDPLVVDDDTQARADVPRAGESARPAAEDGAGTSATRAAEARAAEEPDHRTVAADPVRSRDAALDARTLAAEQALRNRPEPAADPVGGTGRARAEADRVAAADHAARGAVGATSVRLASGASVGEPGGALAATVASTVTVTPSARIVLDRLVDSFAQQVRRAQDGGPDLLAVTPAGPVTVGTADDVVLPPRADALPAPAPSPSAGPATPSGPVVPPGDPAAETAPLDDAASVAEAQGRFAASASGVLGDLLADVTDRRRRAERTLDVLSVVDAVLSGAPAGQVGGIVRTSLGAIDGSAAGVSRGGQVLVSSLQSLNASTTSLADAASPLESWPSVPPFVVTGGDEGAVVGVPLTPGNAGSAAPAVERPGVFGGLLDAVSSLFGRAAPEDGVGSTTPLPPFDARLEVLGVARPFTSVSQASFGAGQLIGGGRVVTVGVTDRTGTEGPLTTAVSVGPGATLGGLVDALSSIGTSARFSTVADGRGGERLMITAAATDTAPAVELTEPGDPDHPSSVLGGFRVLEPGSTTAVRVTWPGAEPFVATSTGSVVDGALPGMRLLVASTAAGSSVDVTVRPEADRLADEVERVVGAASAVLGTVAGTGPLPPAAAEALRADGQIATLTERITAALAGAAAVQPGPVPGVRIGPTGDGAVFARDVFLRAVAEVGEIAETSVRTAARDLGSAARDAADPRAGFLALRIHGEQALAADYSTDVRFDDRDAPSAELVAGRQEAMRSLLAHLDAERAWLGSRLT